MRNEVCAALILKRIDMPRVAVIDKELCRPEKCGLPCIKTCPVNRKGEKCIFIGESGKAEIDESICLSFCNLCTKKCTFKAIQVVNTPEKLKESPIHRFGKNQFVLFRLPYPIEGEVVGLLGPNGAGKTTALNILSGEIKPNLGEVEKICAHKEIDESAYIKDLIKLFRGTELQKYLEKLSKKKIKTVVKPQKIDILANVKGKVSELLKKYDERGKMEEVIEKLQLGACLNRELGQLSGGELQRVAIAVAVSRKADIYYIDEPSSYLDVFQRLQTAKVIRELAKEAAVVVVEHDLATLDLLADKIHVFYGSEGVFGIVSKPYSTRVGINAFLDGYIKEDNVRIRPEEIKFTVAKLASSAESEKIIEWGEIKKNFKDFQLTVKGGCVYKGELLGIFGANAIGKTTFAKILAGELKADKGGENIGSPVKNNVAAAIKISYKPQYITSDFDGTVCELLASVCKDIHSEAYKTDIIRPLGLERLLERNVKNLSGGELQRVAIALCMSKKADLYLLDEPSAFLDSEQRLEAAKTIRKICERRECSAMIIDHDLFFLSYLSDRAMVFTGKGGVEGKAEQFELQNGFNVFLKEVDVTFRKDPQTGRPRANKPGSQKDEEQKANGKYFYV